MVDISAQVPVNADLSMCALNLEISAYFSYFEARLRVVAQEEPQMEDVTTMIS